jgi:ribulose-phosphate 3-epimerase
MDGQFVENISFGHIILGAIDRITDLPLDVHLMVTDPEKQIEKMRASGADMMSVHAEAVREPVALLDRIRRLGAKAGIALNPDTRAEAVTGLLSYTDYILVMGVHPGSSGQKFIESTGPKIQTLRKLIDKNGLDVRLEVDGGINPSTVQFVARAGVDIIVAGDAIFKSPDPASAISELKKLTSL